MLHFGCICLHLRHFPSSQAFDCISHAYESFTHVSIVQPCTQAQSLYQDPSHSSYHSHRSTLPHSRFATSYYPHLFFSHRLTCKNLRIGRTINSHFKVREFCAYFFYFTTHERLSQALFKLPMQLYRVDQTGSHSKRTRHKVWCLDTLHTMKKWTWKFSLSPTFGMGSHILTLPMLDPCPSHRQI